MSRRRARLFWGGAGIAGLAVVGGGMWWGATQGRHLTVSPQSHHAGKPSGHRGFSSQKLVDGAPLWTTAWVRQGVPSGVSLSHGAPGIVANPQTRQGTWWFWPHVVQGSLWMAVMQGHHGHWQPLSTQTLPSASFPVPVRKSRQWIQTLETGHGSMPVVSIQPSGSFVADMGTVTGVNGWTAAMAPNPQTIVLTWGLKTGSHRGIRMITTWQWRGAWQCAFIVLQPEPQATVPKIPLSQAIAHPLPGWVKK